MKNCHDSFTKLPRLSGLHQFTLSSSKLVSLKSYLATDSNHRSDNFDFNPQNELQNNKYTARLLPHSPDINSDNDNNDMQYNP